MQKVRWANIFGSNWLKTMDFRYSISLPNLGFFSPFLHSTCSLSIGRVYLGLEGGSPVLASNTVLATLHTPLRVHLGRRNLLLSGFAHSSAKLALWLLTLCYGAVTHCSTVFQPFLQASFFFARRDLQSFSSEDSVLSHATNSPHSLATTNGISVDVFSWWY